MVNYTCNICFKNFNRKSNYVYHVNNKKTPCNGLCSENIQFAPNLLQKTPEILEHKSEEGDNNNIINTNVYIDEVVNDVLELNSETNKNMKNIHQCLFCGLVFSRYNNLTRHMSTRCKVKKLQDQEKEKIFELLLEKEKQQHNLQMLELKNKYDSEINKQNSQIDELKKMIENIKEKQEKEINKVKTINNNKGININNIVIPQSKLVDFGKEDIKNIPNSSLEKILNKIGAPALVECVKAIHCNTDYPQGMNAYISDKSRNKGMIWHEGEWKQERTRTIFNEVMIQIEQYIDNAEEKIKNGVYNTKNDPKGLKTLHKFDKNVKKYHQRFISDDKNFSEFQKMVQDNVESELRNIKKYIIENYEKMLLEITNSNGNTNTNTNTNSNNQFENPVTTLIEHTNNEK